MAELNDRRNKLTVDLRSADSRIGLLSELEREMAERLAVIELLFEKLKMFLPDSSR